MEQDPFTQRIIGCAIEVHRNLGPGLLESTYQQCLAHELMLQKLPFSQKCPMPVHYKGIQLDCGYRLDFLFEDTLIVELKAADKVHPVHTAQLLTYMKLAQISTGLLKNLNVGRHVDGIQRYKL